MWGKTPHVNVGNKYNIQNVYNYYVYTLLVLYINTYIHTYIYIYIHAIIHISNIVGCTWEALGNEGQPVRSTELPDHG